MRRVLLVMVLSSCRYLGAPMPEVTTENPGLLSNGNVADPTRQTQAPARRCVIECTPGFACNERTASCEAVKVAARDAGPAWLP
jgi:hypothetical protein